MGHAHSRGFTLLELILVLAVLALASALAVPSLGRFTRGRQTTDAAAQLLAVIQYAQDQAANEATPYRVQLDATARTYWLTMLEDGDYARPHSDFGQTFTLPETLTATWDGPPDIAQRGYIQFDPDGGHDVAVIHLVGKEGGDFLIGCPSPSEPYRISQPGDDKENR